MQRICSRAMRMSEKQEYLGRIYYAMEPTDNLLFLTYHMLKHFIYNGMSLRMMMDNALFAKQHLQSIDRERYVDILDATMIQKYAIDKIDLNDTQKYVADVNDDGFIDVLDALDIQKFAVDKIKEFKKK